MSRVTCAISGVEFTVEHFSEPSPTLYIPNHIGQWHPIMEAAWESLETMYVHHTKNKLTKIESYLLFLAYLNQSGKVIWKTPVALDPSSPQTVRLIQNSFAQLVAVIHKSNLLLEAGLEQPTFIIDPATSNLSNLPAWIESWKQNIEAFRNAKENKSELAKLQEEATALAFLTDDLSALIKNTDSPAEYANIIAIWADMAAGFPDGIADKWKKILKSCYNPDQMFRTPLEDLKQIQQYCQINIEPGSIHFHELMRLLHDGIKAKENYLGGHAGSLGYALIPAEAIKAQKDKEIQDELLLLDILEAAPEKMPNRFEYPDFAQYVRAKTLWLSAKTRQKGEQI